MRKREARRDGKTQYSKEAIDKLARNQQCALVAKAASSLLVCVGKRIASRLRKVILLLHSARVKPLSARSSPGIPSTRETWTIL